MGDVWEFMPKTRNAFTKHKVYPAEFPGILPRMCIKLYSLPGDIILEPFVGSATTILEAIKMGRTAIGYEINDKYLNLINNKLGIKTDSLTKYIK